MGKENGSKERGGVRTRGTELAGTHTSDSLPRSCRLSLPPQAEKTMQEGVRDTSEVRQEAVVLE